MKKIILLAVALFSALSTFSQTAEEIMQKNVELAMKIRVENDVIHLGDDVQLQKGSAIQVYLPYNLNKDYLSLEEKQGMFSLKNIGNVADVLGTGALAVGIGSNNVGTTLGAFEIVNKANAVSLGTDALDRISDLPISKKAKKIAGKDFIITDIQADGAGNVVVEGTIEKKKYTAKLKEAIMFGEMRIKK